MHPATLNADEFLKQCKISTGRRGGPGGQHRNKVETAVIITHQPTGIVAEANERRSQASNRVVAVQRLRLRLAVEHRWPVDAVDSPSRLWQSRASGGRVSVSTTHDDFAAMLSELLDRLVVNDLDVPATAAQFQVTASQLIKLLRSHPPALAYINQQREAGGQHPFR